MPFNGVHSLYPRRRPAQEHADEPFCSCLAAHHPSLRHRLDDEDPDYGKDDHLYECGSEHGWEREARERARDAEACEG
jgi:hypothetical protein